MSADLFIWRIFVKETIAPLRIQKLQSQQTRECLVDGSFVFAVAQIFIGHTLEETTYPQIYVIYRPLKTY